MPAEDKTPPPYNLDKIKDGPTPETTSPDSRNFFAYKILLPGTNVCWKQRTILGLDFKDSQGPRALICGGQVAYSGTFGLWLPHKLISRPLSNKKIVTLVLGRSYIGDDPRAEPQIVALWQVQSADLDKASYVVLTSGREEMPGIVLGLIPRFPTDIKE